MILVSGTNGYLKRRVLISIFFFLIDFTAGAENTAPGIWSELTFLSDFFTNVTLAVMRNAEVQKLLKHETFDLIILEAINTDVWYSFGAHFKAPMIGVSSYGTDPIIDDIMGNISPFNYVPLMSTGFTEDMLFTQRIYNLFLKLLELLHNRLVHLPRHQLILEQYMPHIEQDIWSLRRNVSLFLLNQHFSLSMPRPYVPNMVEVGGFQIQHQRKALPKEIQDFLMSSPQDVIYFSMGSNIKSKDFPPEVLQLFNRVFSQLPYKILWKFENPSLNGKPDNVFISSWFPQGDVLAHPRVKLFISHGGLLSTFEATYHGKPILGLPVYFDQQMNVNKAQQRGFAKRLDLPSITEEQLKQAILELMNTASYSQKAKEISQRYHDQPIKPIDLAIYWTEYVLRHKGALHLRNPAHNMNYFKKHGIDCLLALFAMAVSLLLISTWLIKKIVKLFVGQKARKVKIN